MRLPWTAFRAWVYQDAQQQGTALNRDIIGDDALWGLTEHLLATAIDVLQVANWQRASGGKKKPAKPKPIPRPGIGPKKDAGASMPMSQARELFSRHNPAAFGAWQPPAVCSGEGCVRTDLHARGMCPAHYQRWRRGRC